MNEGPLLVFVLIVAGIALTGVVIALVVHARSIKNLTGAYKRMAEGCGGVATPASSFKRPTLRFKRRGANVFVHTLGIAGRGGEFLEIETDWPAAHLRMTVEARTTPFIIDRWVRGVGIQTGERAFDRRHKIDGNDPEAIGEVLSPAARAFIDAIRNLTADYNLYVGIHGGKLVVRKLGRFHEFEELVEIISLAMALYEHLLKGCGAGIEFVEPYVLMSGKPGVRKAVPVCRVCGEPLRTDAVYCVSCLTPHHADCWRYNGACSTYGCGETRFAVARSTKIKRMSPQSENTV